MKLESNCYFLFRKKSKRQYSVQTETNTNVQNLYVEYLAVIDGSVLELFSQLYGNMDPPELIYDYIYIYFSQIINGVSICFVRERGN